MEPLVDHGDGLIHSAGEAADGKSPGSPKDDRLSTCYQMFAAGGRYVAQCASKVIHQR